MDFIKSQLDRIQQQLAGLNATQKMLTAALAAIMVITVIWWGKYASEAEMVPLLNQSLSTNDLGRIQERLEMKQIKYTPSGDRILVPAQQRIAILSDLTFSRLLPQNTQSGIDDIISKMNPFDSASKTDKMWNGHKEDVLSQIIGYMPGVTQARVVIDPTMTRSLDGDTQPRATANIVLDGTQKDPQKVVEAAAALLVGAQSGLDYKHITVIVNGEAIPVRDPSTDSLYAGTDQLKIQKEWEQAKAELVRGALPPISHLSVVVTIKLNTTDMQVDKQDFDAKGTVSKETKISETNEETTGGSGQGGGEAGAVPNTGLSLPAAGGASSGPSQTRSQTETQMENHVPTTHTISHTPAGDATPVSAAISVPYSYFVGEYKTQYTSSKDPTPQDLQPIVTRELAQMKQTVATILQLPDTKVTVHEYTDIVPDTAQQFASASRPYAVSAMVGGHAKEIALGTLALMSLFMASMMVRKSAPTPMPVAAAPAAPQTPPVLIGGEPLAGEVGSGDALLDGMELNDDAIKAQQMVDQVSTMVRENPDAAASLVKRWLNRS
ncbi:MAG TPA: flagellar M-ring protein FliF C-terminal domain-containing protein [Tepidisphaeraceae bacterium]|nr:flagellar M-ring protein FliF C-terminal domain-containing protein [Tepidisphaeraceae bacterium]